MVCVPSSKDRSVHHIGWATYKSHSEDGECQRTGISTRVSSRFAPAREESSRPLSKSQPSASYSEKNLRSHRQSQNVAVSKTLTNLHLYKNIGFESFSRLFLALQPSKSYDLLNALSKHKTHVFFSKATYSEPKTVLQSVHKGKFDGKCIE